MKLHIGRYKWIETEKREERVIEWEEAGEVESLEYFDHEIGEPILKIVLKERKQK